MRTFTILLCVGLVLGCRERAPAPAQEPYRPYYPDARDWVNDPTAPRSVVEDLVTIPGGPFRGRNPACPKPGLAAANAWEDKRPDESLSVAAFSIDRRVATCADYNACVAAGSCGPLREIECSDGKAAVSGAKALDYCRWRGARLPSYREWQRAIRGVDGDQFPTGKLLDEARICERPTSGSRMQRCEHTSAAGVTYAIRNGNLGEWTSELGCTVDAKGAMRQDRITPDLAVKRLDIFYFGVEESEIRCARDAPATAAPAAR